MATQPLAKLLTKQAIRTQSRRTLNKTGIHPLLKTIALASISYFISKQVK